MYHQVLLSERWYFYFIFIIEVIEGGCGSLECIMCEKCSSYFHTFMYGNGVDKIAQNNTFPFVKIDLMGAQVFLFVFNWSSSSWSLQL